MNSLTYTNNFIKNKKLKEKVKVKEKETFRAPLRIAILLIYLTQTNFAIAETQIIYRTPNMSDVEFAALRIARPNATTFDDFQLKNIVPQVIKENLKTAFINAHTAHLKTQAAQNAELWQDVISYAFKADWQKTSREMIQMAYLRLAELASSVEVSKSWVTQCFEYDPLFEPDRKLFNPSVIAQYVTVREKSQLKNFALTRMVGFSKILINGTVFDVNNKKPLSITNGLKRVTLLSPTYKSVTRVISAEYLEQFQPEKEVVASNLITNTDLNTDADTDTGIDYQADFSPSIEKKMDTDKSIEFYQKPWFWVGTAVAIGAFVIYKNSKQAPPAQEPTHRTGL